MMAGSRTYPKHGIHGLCLAVLSPLVLLGGCWARSERELVVYVALDAEFSRPVLDRFQVETGIKVLAKYDVESTKTVGLTNEIIAESDRPRCDVFWNNEILNTLRLAQRGLLMKSAASQRERYPRWVRPDDATWTGFAARARVLLVNTQRLPDSVDWPTRIADLAEPKWHERVGMAKPLFGTTATHATVLWDRWKQEKFRKFFAAVRDNARIYSGNKQVALAVSRGVIDWGVTDTDDAIQELDRGMPVTIVFPDQADGEMGTLLIPNTVSVIQGTPRPRLAEKLVDYLLSAKVESDLATCPSAEFPSRGTFPRRLAFRSRWTCVSCRLTLRKLLSTGMYALACWRSCSWGRSCPRFHGGSLIAVEVAPAEKQRKIQARGTGE